MTANAAIAELAFAEPATAEELVFPEVLLYLDRRPVLVIGDNLYRTDLGSDFAGDPIAVVLERVGWSLEGVGRDGAPRNNPSRVKLLREVWPLIRGTAGTVVNFYFAGQMNIEDALVWQGPYPFTIGTSRSVQPLVEGAFLGIRVTSTNQPEWSLTTLELDLEPTGEVYLV